MNCERAVELLTSGIDPALAEERRRAGEHAATCADCRSAVMSVHALRLMSLAPLAETPRGGFERMLGRLEPAPVPSRPASGRFWLGAVAGAALAAGVALLIALWPSLPVVAPDSAATPRLSLALNETRDLRISLTTSEALADAEIHLSLSGAVGLRGYDGQRELNWRTDLDAGTNELSLPVVATGIGGGQVLVEVVHAGKRRSFLVDVQAELPQMEII